MNRKLPKYIDGATLRRAVRSLQGTAGHLLKVWFTLKQMGLGRERDGVIVDTSNSTPALERLFSFGATGGEFFIPFAHTKRYMTMKSDAARSIIQTNINRWATSGSVVTCDPTSYLNFSVGDGRPLRVSEGRRYPFGLGVGESGFALADGQRVRVPLVAFAIWYGRWTEIPPQERPEAYLLTAMLQALNISMAEREAIFVEDDIAITTESRPLTTREVFEICRPLVDGEVEPAVTEHLESHEAYTNRMRSIMSDLESPAWLRTAPETEVRELLKSGAKAILLSGPPRTGKTRLIDKLIARDDKQRTTIQIHDGWGYDNLVEGFRPDTSGHWGWVDGPLKKALLTGVKWVVLEEINRTSITQALGEVFSVLEEQYRGKEHAIQLRSGDELAIEKDVVILMTMNTVDKSTEEVDDALIGRLASVNMIPRVEDLAEMLAAAKVTEPLRADVARLFAEIQKTYPLGHGYFAALRADTKKGDILQHYKLRVRPVLRNFLGDLRSQELAAIDNFADQIFGGTQ